MFKFKKLATILFLSSLTVSTAFAQLPQAYTSLPNPGLPFVKKITFIKPLKKDTLIHFIVWLKLRNKDQLDQLVRELYDPNSSNYQKFLKHGEFNQKYAPSQDVENAVLHYFATQGMQAKVKNHRVSVTATAQQIEQTFKVKMNYYRYQNRLVYANATAPLIASDIAQHISEISGLNNLIRFQPALRERPHTSKQNNAVKSQNINFIWKSFIPSAQPTTTSFAGFTGAQLQTTYNLAKITPIQNTKINGAGQTLVLIDSCGHNNAATITNDTNRYNTANKLTLLSSTNFAVVSPDGTPFTTCTSPTTDWDKEIALDIESSHTIAPGANVVLVQAQFGETSLDSAVADVVNTLINNNYAIGGFSNAYVVSNSWGFSETGGSLPATEDILETAAAHGISFNFSTGDCGDGTYNSSWECFSNGSLPSVEYPASSAYTTAVGGTSTFVDNNWNYAFEGLWGSYESGFFAGTTGGISQFYGPVIWQNSISDFTAGGYNSGTVGTYNQRAVPDIAMLADPYTGLTIYVTTQSQGQISLVYGGTSLACPLFSGTLTLVNQARTLLNRGTPLPIGQAAPYLYKNNSTLLYGQGLHRIEPPHKIIDGAELPPAGAPLSAFQIYNTFYDFYLTFGWDSSLTISPESQFWNDGVGVGSPNLPNFIPIMAKFLRA